MRARRLVYWIWLPVLVVIAGVAQPLWANAADDTRAALWTAVDTTLRRIQPAGAGHYIAESPANRLTFRFGPDAVEVTPTTKNGAWRWSLRLAGYGAPEAVCPVAPPSVRVGDHRIEYRRGAVTEWYDNRPEELEQGFTLAAPPAHGGSNALMLALRVAGGLTPRLDPSARVLSFHRPDGKAVLRYGKVKVSDARGRSLPARLTLAGDAIEIQVNTRGAAWPVTVDPLVTGAPAEFTAKDAKPLDYFGCSVALAGDTALVGAAFKPSADAANAGAAYVFVFDSMGKKWTEQAKLSLANPAANDFFGVSVALSADGNTALVGADFRETATKGGAAYVFTRSGTSWSEPAELSFAPGGSFGSSLALSADGDTALVGAPLAPLSSINDEPKFFGAAYVFKRSNKVWTWKKTLTATNPKQNGNFGRSVALSSNTALIGAPGMTAVGLAYAYATSADWTLQDTLTVKGRAGAGFGSDVALSGDTALVAAPVIAAYVFVRSTEGKWIQKTALTPGVAGSDFASCAAPTCVALSGDLAVVGAPGPFGALAGTVYVYKRSGETLTRELIPSQYVGQFGYAVAVSGDTALVGASGTNRGYVYTFTPSPGNGYTPFATFDITQFSAVAATHNLSLKTTFTLGQGSNGINPLKEALILTVGGYTTVIPAGGFTQADEPVGNGPAQKLFLYGERTGDTWVEAQIIPIRHGKNKSYLFQIWEWGRAVTLAEEAFVPIELTIGHDQGTSAEVR